MFMMISFINFKVCRFMKKQKSKYLENKTFSSNRWQFRGQPSWVIRNSSSNKTPSASDC